MDNFEFDIATQYVNYTETHIFLTGKAGTGKTTFLKHIAGSTDKKMIVLAPTGVAAINAGGVTIHSMFGLPTRAHIPSHDYVDPNLANNRSMMLPHFHYGREKLKVLKELELMVIDEISMVRADVLDAVDLALRYVRKNEKPFGGVQVLFIGDMYQLPPVVKDDEWPLLSNYYSTPYFFSAKAFAEIQPVFIELKKIYRQSDRGFISLLNNIRHQEFEEEDYFTLKELYKPDFVPDEPGYITLTSHNKKADVINEEELKKLDGREYQFEAMIEGDFFESLFPAEKVLRLKIGAQVMFLKNDVSGERRYFNGKIGIVEKINDDGIHVLDPVNGKTIIAEKEVWENVKYKLSDTEGKMDKDVVGSFKQYPLRLAWAITIHKSQGLTFEKAIIDAGESFAPGQVYVALSRCTGLKGIVLKSTITSRNIISDQRIVEFSSRSMGEMELENRLTADRKLYAQKKLVALFGFEDVIDKINDWRMEWLKMKSLDKSVPSQVGLQIMAAAREIESVAVKFRRQLLQLIAAENAGQQGEMDERLNKAIGYFAESIYNGILTPLQSHIAGSKYKVKMKRYVRETEKLTGILQNRLNALYGCVYEGVQVFKGEKIFKPEAAEIEEEVAKRKSEDMTLALWTDGKSIEEIAELRSLAVSTIETHLFKLIGLGKIRVEEVITLDKLERITKSLSENGKKGLLAVKMAAGADITFSDLRYVQASQRAAHSATTE